MANIKVDLSEIFTYIFDEVHSSVNQTSQARLNQIDESTVKKL